MKKEFNELWKLHPSGEKERTFELYSAIIEQKVYTFDGEFVDNKYLATCLKKYLEYWDYTFGKRDKKYIGTKDQKVTLQFWLASSMWEQEYIIDTNTRRDRYIFGDYTIAELKEKIKQFEIILYGKPKGSTPF